MGGRAPRRRRLCLGLHSAFVARAVRRLKPDEMSNQRRNFSSVHPAAM
jgi:hypothetical protein